MFNKEIVEYVERKQIPDCTLSWSLFVWNAFQHLIDFKWGWNCLYIKAIQYTYFGSFHTLHQIFFFQIDSNVVSPWLDAEIILWLVLSLWNEYCRTLQPPRKAHLKNSQRFSCNHYECFIHLTKLAQLFLQFEPN